MPIDCLDDYIGFRGLCATDVPPSGLYVNNLPDLGLARFEALVDQENPTAKAVWEKIYGRAQDHFGSDVSRVLNQVRTDNGETGIKVHTVVNNHISGQLLDDGQDVAASAQLKGVWIDVSGSPYMDVSFPDIYMYLKAAGNVPIYVYDTITGNQLYTASHAGVEGYNTFAINQSFWLRGGRRQFFIAYDATAINSFETDVSPVESCRDCAWTSYMNMQPGISAVVDPLVKSAIDFSIDNAGGLTVGVNLNCKIQNFICMHRDILAVALRRKAAIEIIYEMFDTDTKISPVTMQSSERLTERLNRHLELYEQELYSALVGIRPDEDGICFECVDLAAIVYNVP